MREAELQYVAIRDIPAALEDMGFPRLHKSIGYRWVKAGTRGAKLQSVLVGGKRFTRTDWLKEFVFNSQSDSGKANLSSCSSAGRAEQANKELDDEGI